MAAARRGISWLRLGPLLVGAAVAGPEDELRPVGGVRRRVVEAHARVRVHDLAVGRRPLLVGAAVAGPQLDEGAVDVLGAGDVHAAAGDGEGAVAVDGPVLCAGVAVTVPDLHLGAVGAAAVVVVHALGAAEAGLDRAGRAARAAGGRGVAGRDDVGLDGRLSARRREAGGHDALVEGAGGALAVVAADAEDDRALLVHRVVARGADAAEVRRQGTGLRVAAEDGPVVRLALDHRGGEPEVGGRVGRVEAGALAGEQAVLHVGHDPRAATRAAAPGGFRPEVDGFHVAGAVVVVVRLCVAVVEAASVVCVRAVEDGVLALGRVAGRDARGAVVAVAVARGDEDAVNLRAVDHGRGRGSV